MSRIIGLVGAAACASAAAWFAVNRGINWESLAAVFAGVIAVLFLVGLPKILLLGLASTFVAVAVLAAGALEVWNYVGFGTWSLKGPPPKVHWCGHNYAEGSSPVAVTPQGPYGFAFSGGHLVLVTVGSTPSASMILGTAKCVKDHEPPVVFIKAPQSASQSAPQSDSFDVYTLVTGAHSTGLNPTLPGGVTVPTGVTLPHGGT